MVRCSYGVSGRLSHDTSPPARLPRWETPVDKSLGVANVGPRERWSHAIALAAKFTLTKASCQRGTTIGSHHRTDRTLPSSHSRAPHIPTRNTAKCAA